MFGTVDLLLVNSYSKNKLQDGIDERTEECRVTCCGTWDRRMHAQLSSIKNKGAPLGLSEHPILQAPGKVL
jgi:hypothetical protein